MRRCLLLLLLVTCPVLADQVMVLATQGSGRAIVNGTAVPLRTGLVLQPADRLELKAGDRATLLLIPRGQRQDALGASVLTVTEAGLQAQGRELVPVAGETVSLVPTGKNMRHMAGQAMRAEPPMRESPIRDLQVKGTRVSWLSAAGGTLKASVYSQPKLWRFDPTRREPVLRVDAVDGLEDVPLQEATATGVREGKAWRYSMELKPTLAGTLGLRIVDARGEALSTRIWVGAAPQLEEGLRQAAAWAEREPGSPQPYVVKMALLDEYDRLPEAIQAGREALARAPGDPGLNEQLARLSLALGRYAEALKYYRQSPRSTKGAQ